MCDHLLMWIIAGLGVVALGGSFWKMKEGFGQYNLRVIGVIPVGTFSALLASQGGDSTSAAFSVLGAIAGYLFSVKEPA